MALSPVGGALRSIADVGVLKIIGADFWSDLSRHYLWGEQWAGGMAWEQSGTDMSRQTKDQQKTKTLKRTCEDTLYMWPAGAVVCWRDTSRSATSLDTIIMPQASTSTQLEAQDTPVRKEVPKQVVRYLVSCFLHVRSTNHEMSSPAGAVCRSSTFRAA